MNRRDFLRSASIVSAGLAFPETARLFAEETLPSGWRTFEVTTRVEVLKPSGATRIWLPVPLTSKTPFQRTLANKFTAEGGAAKLVESKARRTRNRHRGISRRREAHPHAQEPCRDKEHCRRSLRARQGAESGSRRTRSLSAADQSSCRPMAS